MKRVLMATLALLCAALPSSAEQEARVRANAKMNVVTDEDIRAEVNFGREVAAAIAGKYKIYQNEQSTRHADLVAKSLARFANRPELNFTVVILDADPVMAVSAPGGYIFVSRGAMAAMDDEAELAGVLAHEIIHVSRRHIVNELNIRGMDTSPAAGLSHLIGGASDAVKLALQKAMGEAMKIMFESGFKRSDEIEADTMGTVLLSSAGYDCQALDRFLGKLKSAEGAETAEIEKIHAPFDERRKLIGEAIVKNGLPEGGFRGRERFHQFMSDFIK
jgi:predicted Zn-dependent protease